MNNNIRISVLKKRFKYWSENEKKTVLRVLKRYGPDDIQRFQNVLPRKSKHQIKTYLNKFRKTALVKLNEKHYYYEWQNNLKKIHQWLPFINVNCLTKPMLHNYLPAYILPIIQRYACHSLSTETANVDFRSAYTALFNSLVGLPFPNNINDETLSMIFMSFNQLLEDIKKEKLVKNNVLKKALDKCLHEQKEVIKIDPEVLEFPEMNVFRWSQDEINLLCEI